MPIWLVFLENFERTLSYIQDKTLTFLPEEEKEAGVGDGPPFYIVEEEEKGPVTVGSIFNFLTLVYPGQTAHRACQGRNRGVGVGHEGPPAVQQCAGERRESRGGWFTCTYVLIFELQVKMRVLLTAVNDAVSSDEDVPNVAKQATQLPKTVCYEPNRLGFISNPGVASSESRRCHQTFAQARSAPRGR